MTKFLICKCGKAGVLVPAGTPASARFECAACCDARMHARGMVTADEHAHVLPTVVRRIGVFPTWRDRSEGPPV